MSNLSRITVFFAGVLCSIQLVQAGAIGFEDIPDVSSDVIWWDKITENDVGYAEYDYTTSTGLVGDAPENYYLGSDSVLDLGASGIVLLDGVAPGVSNWQHIQGKGWQAPEPPAGVGGFNTATFYFGNVRVASNVKWFSQAIEFSGGTLDHVSMRTDKDTDLIWPDKDKVIAKLNPSGDMVTVSARITPQPEDVWVTFHYKSNSPLVIHSGWVLDQCRPVPLPGGLVLTAVGLLTLAAGRRLRRR